MSSHNAYGAVLIQYFEWWALLSRFFYDTHCLERLEVELIAMKTAQQRSQADLYTIKRSSEVVVLKNVVFSVLCAIKLCCRIKRSSEVVVLKECSFFCAMCNKVVLQEDRQRIWDNVNELQEITNITTRSQFYLSMKIYLMSVIRNPPSRDCNER